MAYTPRLFAGALTPGDYRARISKPGKDASDPNLGREHIDFDTAWPFAGNIHAVLSYRPPNPPAGSGFETVPNPRTFYFPALPYVPVVKCFLMNRNAPGIIYWIEQNLQTVSYEIYQDRVDFFTRGTNNFGVIMVAVVFKIPARDVDGIGNDPHPLGRMMMGKRGSDYGLYASRPGFDVRYCSKEQMAFSSDATYVDVNATISGAQQGVASSPTDNVQTIINFTYPWKGYSPIVFFFCTISQTEGNQNQTYTLPSDRVVNTWGSGYPVDGSIFVEASTPGQGYVRVRRIGSQFRLHYSIIVLDIPLPTF